MVLLGLAVRSAYRLVADRHPDGPLLLAVTGAIAAHTVSAVGEAAWPVPVPVVVLGLVVGWATTAGPAGTDVVTGRPVSAPMIAGSARRPRSSEAVIGAPSLLPERRPPGSNRPTGFA